MSPGTHPALQDLGQVSGRPGLHDAPPHPRDPLGGVARAQPSRDPGRQTRPLCLSGHQRPLRSRSVRLQTPPDTAPRPRSSVWSPEDRQEQDSDTEPEARARAGEGPTEQPHHARDSAVPERDARTPEYAGPPEWTPAARAREEDYKLHRVFKKQHINHCLCFSNYVPLILSLRKQRVIIASVTSASETIGYMCIAKLRVCGVVPGVGMAADTPRGGSLTGVWGPEDVHLMATTYRGCFSGSWEQSSARGL